MSWLYGYTNGQGIKSMDDYDETALKETINNFLWQQLPASTTMEEAELIACDIFAMMDKAYKNADRSRKTVSANG